MFRSSMNTDARKIATDIRGIAYGGTAVASFSTLSTDETEVRGRQRRPLAKNVADLSGVRMGRNMRPLVCLALCVMSSYGEGEQHLQQETRDSRQQYPAVVRAVVLVLQRIGVGGEKRK